jgi:hypothetical protein
LLEYIEPAEVSPVFAGSGVNTGTLAVKAADTAAAAEVARFKSIVARAARPVGLDLDARYWPFLKWAARRFGMEDAELPDIRLVHPSRLPRGATGKYQSGLVLVRADLPDRELRATLIHELAHHYEARYGWLGSETFAYGQEAELLGRWEREQGRAAA